MLERSYMKIWVDADACPKIVKELLFKSCLRLEIPICLVANSYMNVPFHKLVSFVKVESGDDVADMYIANHIAPEDLVVTADIPLAAQVVEKGTVAINPRGELYDDENIGERLSMRDFMKDLRDSGVVTGGPEPFGAKDKENFANSLSKILAQKGYK